MAVKRAIYFTFFVCFLKGMHHMYYKVHPPCLLHIINLMICDWNWQPSRLDNHRPRLWIMNCPVYTFSFKTLLKGKFQVESKSTRLFWRFKDTKGAQQFSRERHAKKKSNDVLKIENERVGLQGVKIPKSRAPIISYALYATLFQRDQLKLPQILTVLLRLCLIFH